MSPPARLFRAAVVSLALTATAIWLFPAWSQRAGIVLLVATGAPVISKTSRGLLKGHFASDIVATLAIVGAIVLWQPFAGLVIVVMQTGGELLEQFAEGRASAAVADLEAQAPRIAHRMTSAGVEDLPAESVAVGDEILVRPGEMIPCDGTVTRGKSHLEVARLTGEPSPERVGEGSIVRSGAVNLEAAIHVRVTARASDSLYERIVDLVRTAQTEKAPVQRMADRYAAWFTPVTLAVCAIAWFTSHDPVRVLAVLVVATPCPLILATPVAIIGGINRAARHQVIVRTGAALEQIGRVDAAVFDKTGTLTVGYPEVAAIRPLGATSETDLLSAAAAVETHSGHLLARTVVAAAEERGVAVPEATDSAEASGRGVTGRVGGRLVSVGSLTYVAEAQPTSAAALIEAHEAESGLHACVAIDGQAAGMILYADRTRDGLPGFFAELRALGVTRTLLVSGDHERNVAAIARTLGIGEAIGDQLPDQKAAIVKRLAAEGHRVMMTGDGTNDAPALSAASVGIALAAHGGGISAEAADIVLLADDVTRVATAIRVGRRATRIARQSIGVGLGLSAAAMVAAALGFIPPTTGAVLQEAVDVAVILNALRASSA